MKINISNISAGVFLFIAGLLAGFSTKVSILSMLSFGDILPALNIIVVASIGLLALYTWKHQFKHAERFKAAFALESSMRDYLQRFFDYRQFHSRETKNKELIDPEVEIFKSSEYEAQKKSYMKYEECWSYLLPHLSVKEINRFESKPDELQRELFQLLTSAEKVCQGNFDSYKDVTFHESMVEIRKRITKATRRFREFRVFN